MDADGVLALDCDMMRVMSPGCFLLSLRWVSIAKICVLVMLFVFVLVLESFKSGEMLEEFGSGGLPIERLDRRSWADMSWRLFL